MNPTKMAFQEADSVLCQTYNVFADPEALFEATKFDDENIGHNYFDPVIALSRCQQVTVSKILLSKFGSSPRTYVFAKDRKPKARIYSLGKIEDLNRTTLRFLL